MASNQLYGLEIEVCGTNIINTKSLIKELGLNNFFSVCRDYSISTIRESYCWKCKGRGIVTNERTIPHFCHVCNGEGMFGRRIQGSEIKTKKPFKFTKKNLIKIRTLLSGLSKISAYVDNSTGIHIHVDTRTLSLRTIKSILLNYCVREEFVFDKLNKRSSIDNIYARRLNGSQHTKIKNAKTKLDIRYDKYYSVSTSNITKIKKQTIEFRLFDSTTNFKKLLSYFLWVDRLVMKNKDKVNKNKYTTKYELVEAKIRIS